MSVIYKIENIQNGRFYIGKTTQKLLDRFRGHKNLAIKNNSDSYLHNSIRKYGIENFVISIIEDNIDIQNLNQREIYWISVLSPHYNLTKGGDGGDVMRPEKRAYYAKLKSESSRGSNNHFYGKTHTQETKQHLSSVRKGVPSPHRGKKRPQYIVDKIVLSRKESGPHPAHNKGVPMTQEAKDHMSKIMTGRESKRRGISRPGKTTSEEFFYRGIKFNNLRQCAEILNIKESIAFRIKHNKNIRKMTQDIIDKSLQEYLHQ